MKEDTLLWLIQSIGCDIPEGGMVRSVDWAPGQRGVIIISFCLSHDRWESWVGYLDAKRWARWMSQHRLRKLRRALRVLADPRIPLRDRGRPLELRLRRQVAIAIEAEARQTRAGDAMCPKSSVSSPHAAPSAT